MKLFDGLMWQQRADETLAQSVRVAAKRCEAKHGWAPTIALVHQGVKLPMVEGVDVQHSSYISSPGLVFVGRERKEEEDVEDA